MFRFMIILMVKFNWYLEVHVLSFMFMYYVEIQISGYIIWPLFMYKSQCCDLMLSCMTNIFKVIVHG